MSSMSARFDYVIELMAHCQPYNPSQNVSTFNTILNFDINTQVKNACRP